MSKERISSLIIVHFSELSPNHNPTWPDAHQRFGATQVNFDHVLLVSNDLFLTVFLLSYTKLQKLPDDFERVTFLQDLQCKVAEKKVCQEMEAKVMLVWGFLIISGSHVLIRSEHSKNQLLGIARYFKINVTQPEGWGDGILGAIGLKKDAESNKKKILLRCLSCAIFAIFTVHFNNGNERFSIEYEEALTELKSALSNKKFADIRMTGLQALSLIESKKETMLDNFSNTISSLIRMFYQDSFLTTIEYFNNW